MTQAQQAAAAATPRAVQPVVLMAAGAMGSCQAAASSWGQLP